MEAQESVGAVDGIGSIVEFGKYGKIVEFGKPELLDFFDVERAQNLVKVLRSPDAFERVQLRERLDQLDRRRSTALIGGVDDGENELIDVRACNILPLDFPLTVELIDVRACNILPLDFLLTVNFPSSFDSHGQRSQRRPRLNQFEPPRKLLVRLGVESNTQIIDFFDGEDGGEVQSEDDEGESDIGAFQSSNPTRRSEEGDDGRFVDRKHAKRVIVPLHFELLNALDDELRSSDHRAELDEAVERGESEFLEQIAPNVGEEISRSDPC